MLEARDIAAAPICLGFVERRSCRAPARPRPAALELADDRDSLNFRRS
jgi:hypothetical protein